MSNKIEKLRGKGIVCFEKNGFLWMNIDDSETLNIFLEQNGWDSGSEFKVDTDLAVSDIIGETVAFNSNSSSVLFAKDKGWWNTLDIDRLKAVFNERIFDWALSGAFLSFMGELEFGLNVIGEMKKVSGQEISDELSSIFIHQVWYPAKDTTGFLEDVAGFLMGRFDVVITESTNIKYYV